MYNSIYGNRFPFITTKFALVTFANQANIEFREFFSLIFDESKSYKFKLMLIGAI